MMISWISDRGGFQQFIALLFFILLLLVFFFIFIWYKFVFIFYKLLFVDGKTLFTKTWLANIVKILVTVKYVKYSFDNNREREPVNPIFFLAGFS